MRAHAEPFPAALDGDTVLFGAPQSRVSRARRGRLPHDGDVLRRRAESHAE